MVNQKSLSMHTPTDMKGMARRMILLILARELLLSKRRVFIAAGLLCASSFP